MSTRVFVGGLTYKVRERDVEKFFRKYGRIKEVSMKNGYAFVEFEDYRDAEDAVYEMNGKDLMGDRVTVERARGTPRGSDRWRDRERDSGYGSRPPPRREREREPRGRDKYGPPTRTEYRVVVENLSSRCSWQDLKDYMRKAGEVTYADAHKQAPNEGVVEFASLSDMKNAIEKLDDTEINGRRIKLVESSGRAVGGGRRNKSVSRSRSRSHSRRRSRSRSHSRSHSRSKSPRKSRSRSKEASRSRSGSRNNRSRSLSKENENPKRSPSRSRSRDN